MSEASPRIAASWRLLDRYGGLAVVLVAALPVRLVGFKTWWLNPDEGIYYSLVTRSTWSGFWSEVTANAHPPLYYLLLRFSGHLTWDFLWLRALSLVWGLLAVYAVWLAARELGGLGRSGTVAGLVAALVVAFAPGLVALSQVMRPYTMQLALLAGALWLLLRHLRTDEVRPLAGYLCLLCLALLTHYSSVLALAVFGAVVALDGLERGWRRPGWRRLAGVHVLPVLLLGALYVFHLGPLMSSELADEALDGWLSHYMVGSPREAWLAVMGFQSLLGTAWIRGPLVVLTVVGVVVAAVRRERLALVLGLAAFTLGVAAAATGAYPLGSTRHSVWLVTFAAPLLGWLAGTLTSLSRRVAVPAVVALVVLFAAGDPVGRWLGRAGAPWAPTERVLRWDRLATMVDLLDPASGPELTVMSSQTFYILLPLYPAEREGATFSPDSSLFHFRLGERDVVVSRAWIFAATPGAEGGGRLLADVLRRADETFEEVDFERRPVPLLLVGGWRPPLVADLTELARERGFALERREVPGLVAFLLDAVGYVEAVSEGDEGLPPSAASSFRWSPPNPPFDMTSTTSPVEVPEARAATIRSTSGT
jgi:hypothetical protein